MKSRLKDYENVLFEELNRQLAEADLHMEVICAGGFVLSQYDIRATLDIDGFYEADARLRKLIRNVGEKYKVNTVDETWLNNSVQNMNERPPDDICETLYEYSNLIVKIPPLEYVAGMKLFSARKQDVEDVADILKIRNITSPREFREQLNVYGFDAGRIDESLLLECFGIAYGYEWLEEYYIAHEEELI